MRSTPSGTRLATADATMLCPRATATDTVIPGQRDLAAHPGQTITSRGETWQRRRSREKPVGENHQRPAEGSRSLGEPSPPARDRDLRPDLLRVRADLERFGISARELVHRGLEFCTLAIRIAGD